MFIELVSAYTEPKSVEIFGVDAPPVHSSSRALKWYRTAVVLFDGEGLPRAVNNSHHRDKIARPRSRAYYCLKKLFGMQAHTRWAKTQSANGATSKNFISDAAVF